MSSALNFQDHGREAWNHEDVNNKIYFAVGSNIGGSWPWPNLSWVARNFPGQTICFLHILQPTKMIPSKHTPQGGEKKRIQDILKNYHPRLGDTGGVEEVYLKLQKVEEGIVTLISQLKIKNLVMGAAAGDKFYLRSKIIKYVSVNGSESCQMWFIHEGHLIKTRYEQVITAVSSTKETSEESSRREKAEKESVEAVRKEEGTSIHELYEGLEQAMAEVENSKREAFEESSIRRKTKKDAVDASRLANAGEIKVDCQLVAVMAERDSALLQNSLLEDEIADLKKDNKKLTEKIVLSVDLLHRFQNERDEFKAERDRALIAADERRHLAECSRSSGSLPQLFEFSYSEVKDATHLFDPSFKIDEWGHWRVYTGVLRHIEVAVKLLDADSWMGPSEYRQEVDALSRLRHPNIVTLIGACPEALAIIYEHFPNGSLEDRLNCKNNSSPLPWQTRIHIAVEICSVLIFLHSSKSHCIVHGDLKPSNILLDGNFTSKLGHFGHSRVMTTATGEYTPELDDYSFGILLLILLTGKKVWDIRNEVQLALDKGNLNSLLDCSGGDWPYVQAQQLARIGLSCTDVSRKNRPDLESDVLGVLQKMKASCQGSPMRSQLGGDLVHSQAPPYYICPINQDVMQDPRVAADGFTYEYEAIQGWLLSGHDTSPMTNLKLDNKKLVPNRALRSAIQEWRHN
ncbi:unnamed protein product [Rhodiola kirilowii]